MLKTEVNTLVKKGIQSTMILKKAHRFFFCPPYSLSITQP